MAYARVEAALAQSRAHLAATGSFNTEIEAYLVGYLLATAYSSLEARVRLIVATRSARNADAESRNFIRKASGGMIRRIAFSDLVGYIGMFSDSLKESFRRNLDDRDVSAYDNLLTNRHNVAHNSGSNMTLSDLDEAFKRAERVLDEFASCLGLTPAEVVEADEPT